MRVVVYDSEGFEPITVIEVPGRFLHDIEVGKRGPTLVFQTRPTPTVSAEADSEQVEPCAFHTVRLMFEPVFKGQERRMWLATTQDGETALLLRCAFLPGQYDEVNTIEREAFLAGFLAAFDRMDDA